MNSEAISDDRVIEAVWTVPENEGTSFWRLGHPTHSRIERIDLYEESGPYSPIVMVRVWRDGEVFIRVPMMVCAIQYKPREKNVNDS